MTTNKDALDRLYGGSFGFHIRDGDEIQQDYELLCQALQTQAELVEAGKELKEIVEGLKGSMEHGTWRNDNGERLKDTPEWVKFYLALARAEGEE